MIRTTGGISKHSRLGLRDVDRWCSSNQGCRKASKSGGGAICNVGDKKLGGGRAVRAGPASLLPTPGPDSTGSAML